jgi:hypothetical protein
MRRRRQAVRRIVSPRQAGLRKKQTKEIRGSQIVSSWLEEVYCCACVGRGVAAQDDSEQRMAVSPLSELRPRPVGVQEGRAQYGRSCSVAVTGRFAREQQGHV